jgi:DNA processing protein
MRIWNKYKIQVIYKIDFPEQIKHIKNCPEKLYYRGEWNNAIFDKSMAIVGSRKMTKYGESVIDKFVPELVANKLTIISGFMYGVDTAAHRKCVEFGGVTIAVLGGGLDNPSVPENDDLYSDILNSGGLMISEYEPDFKPTLWSFPQRNRIVSGLTTKGVLVVEAGLKSGSLITARIAKEQGKKVFAVPGPIINGNSQGTNWLIAENQAKIVTSVTELTNKNVIVKQENLFTDQTEKKIVEFIKLEPLTIDELSRKLNLGVGDLLVKISLMSMSGIIVESNGKIYSNND